MVEGCSKRNRGDYKGSLSNGKKAVFRSKKELEEILGRYTTIKITSVTSKYLVG